MNNKKNEIKINLGWLIALFPVVWIILSIFDSIWVANFLYFLLCFCDDVELEKGKIRIAWGWCLLPPVYLYKRAKLLKESLLKFWLLVIQIGLLVSFVISATLSLYTANVKQCIDRLAQDGVNVYVAKEVCECSMEYNEKFCLKRYEIIE